MSALRMPTVAFSALVLCLLWCSPQARADFNNGSFELQSFSGWQVQYADYQGNKQFSNWQNNHGTHPAAQIISSFTYDTLTVPAYCGSWMAQLNAQDTDGSPKNATRIRQTLTFSGNGTDPNCPRVRVRWGALLQDGGHPAGTQPFFSIEISLKRNFFGSTERLAYYEATANDGSGGWTQYNDWFYKDDVFDVALGIIDPGDEVEVTMIVADCAEEEHDGLAFIDCAEIYSSCDAECFTPLYQVVTNPWIPNAFTPNGDGKNDTHDVFCLIYVCAVEYAVYDRWGQGNKLLFIKRESFPEGCPPFYTMTGWDGKVNGNPAQQDVYVYKLRLQNCEQTKTIIGSATLIR